MNSLQGINLTLLVGPALPIPAPKVIMDALTSVTVTNGKDQSGFQLSFTVGKDSPILNTYLPAGYFDPIITRVILVATVNGFPQAIMDGLVTNQEFAPSNEPGKSTLTITGKDLSLAMDLVEYTIPYPAILDIGKVYLILAKYLALGIIPLAFPPFIPSIETPTETWTTQSKMTDKAFLTSLAQKFGYIFMVQPGPFPGQSIAYFGPDANVPMPQKALSINFDAASNSESISFSLDGLAKKIRLYTIMDPITKKIPMPIPVPNINMFKPPLGARMQLPSKFESGKDLAKLKPAEAASDILGFMMSGSNSITASGSFDVMRYGTILRSRMMVGVRGAGIAYDGMYYVDSVTHNIKKGEYKQNFSLSRDGLISNTPNLLV
jgi:hypothetical protein